MNSKKDNEDHDDKNSNDNNAENNNKSNENLGNSNFSNISNDSKGDESDNSKFTDHSSTRSLPNGKSTSPSPSKGSNNYKQKINNEIKGITKKINVYKVASINKKIIYSAIGIIAVAVIIMIFSQGYNFKFNQEAVTEAKDLEISLKNVSITNIDNNNIKINTIFNVYNPNKEL